MVRSRITVFALVVLGAAASAQAQSFPFTGFLTGHVGVSATNDVRDPSATPGGSMAVVDNNGLGVELDIAYLGGFDDTLFSDSGITSAMLSVIAVRQHQTLRPFFVIGAGIMRVSGTGFAGQPSVRLTEGGWTAGGGMHYMFHEALGLRGDVRYFRHFSRSSDLPLSGNGVLDFWRMSFGVTMAWAIQ